MDKMKKEFNLSLHEQVNGYYPKDKVKEFIKKLKENQEKLKEALARFADINRKASMPMVEGDIYLFGKTIKEYLEIDKLAGSNLIELKGGKAK